MRLAGIDKGGFYPYPNHMAEATASWFVPPPTGARGRLLDPGAGEGGLPRLPRHDGSSGIGFDGAQDARCPTPVWG